MPRTRESAVDHYELDELVLRQAGVVSRRQVLACGGDDVDIRRLLRRREWARIHEGVYVAHTGTPTWTQRLWAAVLLCWPAAAHRESALQLAGLTRDRAGKVGTVHVIVDSDRHVASAPGIEVERVVAARSWLDTYRWPPRVKVELALLKVASERDLAGAIAVLADAVQQDTTTVTDLLAALDRLGRLPQRRVLLDVLADVESGAFSVLEQRFMVDVERAHALPSGARQVRTNDEGRVRVRDVSYREHGVLVELDGRFGHSDAEDRWTDLDRDLAAAVAELLTVRLGWSQVLEPCRVAVALAAILRARGWTGRPRGCSPACPLADLG